MKQFDALPLVGIVGVSNRHHQDVAVVAAMQARPDIVGGTVLLGINANAVTQGEDEFDERYGPAYPIGIDLAEVACNEDSGWTNAFVNFHFEGMVTPQQAEASLKLVRNRAICYLRGLQVNGLPWLDTMVHAPVLADFKEEKPNQGLIVDVPHDTLRHRTYGDLQRQVGRLFSEGANPDYISISELQVGGGWQDKGRLAGYVDAIRSVAPEVGIVLSGHLSHINMAVRVGPLMDRFGNISCSLGNKLCRGSDIRRGLDDDRVREAINVWTDLQTRANKLHPNERDQYDEVDNSGGNL